MSGIHTVRPRLAKFPVKFPERGNLAGDRFDPRWVASRQPVVSLPVLKGHGLTLTVYESPSRSQARFAQRSVCAGLGKLFDIVESDRPGNDEYN